MTSTQEFQCIFCKESFNNKEELQIHFRKHGDPKFNHKNRARVQSSEQVSSESNKDESEMVGCDVCSEVFTTISKAITHKHKIHPEHDAKYFCPWCGKLFTMKHLYNKHMQTNHNYLEKFDENFFHCDSCNVDFNLPTAMIYHNRFFHRQDTDIPIFGLSKKLKMYYQAALPIYYCSFCGEEYENKVNLHKHTIDDHSDENQSPDMVLRCPLCDAIFYHLDAYELHLTFHTPDDLYSERSEIADDLNEYSLESVPPIMEKVETCEKELGAETAMNGLGIEDFLEQALEEPDDLVLKKNKKHKKHKKSKKSAITLDEFLNMNKDVFGEGLDFQGIEEIPTREINKKLKVIKKPPTVKSEINPELEKLRKHGIVIKKKPGQNNLIHNKGLLKIPLKLPPKVIPNKINSEPIVSTSEDTIDKLMNQTNSQIKIVKKTSKENLSSSHITPDSNKSVKQSNTMECDSTKKDIEECPANEVALENMSAVDNNDEQSNVRESVSKPKRHIRVDTDETQYDDIDNMNSDCERVEHGSKIQTETLKEKNSNSLKVESTSDGMDDITSQTDDNDNVPQECDTNLNSFSKVEKPNSIDSLSSLKRLSHLITVKPVLSNKNVLKTESTLAKNVLPMTAKDDVETSTLRDMVAKVNVCETNLKNSEFVDDLLMEENRNFQIKSLLPQAKSETKNSTCQENEDTEFDNRSNINIKSQIPNTTILRNENPKSFEVVQSKHTSPNVGKISSIVEQNSNDMNKQNTTNLLKHLTSITAKPLRTTKNKNHALLTIKNLINIPVKKILPQKELVNNEEIEIYNIDDSDDEDQHEKSDVSKTTQPTDVFKNLSKNITIKSLTNTASEKSQISREVQKEKLPSDIKKLTIDQPQSGISNDAYVGDPLKSVSSKSANTKNVALIKTMKYLGKNVTVKISNSSSLPAVHSKNHNGHDRDSLKIMEMTDRGCEDESENEDINDNPIVASPEESHGEQDENNDIYLDQADFETQVEANMVKKDDDRFEPAENEELPQNIAKYSIRPENSMSLNIAKNLGNQISIKPVKQVKKEVKHENGDQMYEKTSSNSQIKQKTSMSNQVNTINKQVMVKTFQTQTKTVIQEITTTVTKTIKTVNQTLKQEIKNVNNYSSKSLLPQKVQGVRVQQPSRNLQGIVVRQSSPPMRPKVRNASPATSAIGTTVRHSSPAIPLGTPVRALNQIVPIRPRSNVVLAMNPKMPSVQKIRPSTSNQNSAKVVKPLRVSTEAFILPVKRPSMEDTSGPFSCFKKPKESLIPVSDVPTLNDGDSESMADYMSVSKTNSLSTVSSLKGNSVVTSTNTKSEVNTKSQQLSRLNTSGMKVKKTSQSKQAQVQETSEISASQRTTLEAIQKLQKQGLLVKKPRLEIRQNSDGSDHSGDNSIENE